MNSLLIDNWTIEKAIANYSTENQTAEIKRIICFMVLWDEVYYLNNQRALWWRERVDDREDLYFLLDIKPIDVDESYNGKTEQIYQEYYREKETAIVAKGAIEYLLYAEKNDVCYAPVDERSEFIRKNELTDTYTRNDILGYIDKELLGYYKLSADKIRSADISLVTETLYNMLSVERKKNRNTSEIITALKNKPMIKNFRKWVNGFENDIKAGNYLLIDEYLNELHDIQQSDIDLSVSAELALYPMITMDLQLPLFKEIGKKTAKFMFPCYLYKKGKQNSKNIVFPPSSVLDRLGTHKHKND